jgi:hypothetical protein
MSSYVVTVRGPGVLIGGKVTLDCDTDEQALKVACAIDSPFGHELFCDGKFVAAFEASWGADFPEFDEEADDDDGEDWDEVLVA